MVDEITALKSANKSGDPTLDCVFFIIIKSWFCKGEPPTSPDLPVGEARYCFDFSLFLCDIKLGEFWNYSKSQTCHGNYGNWG